MKLPACIFCQIIKGTSSARIVYENDEVIAFEDVNPQAPVHILLVPRKHISSITELSGEDVKLVGNIYLVAKKIARDKNIENGFRIVVNSGAKAGQSIYHLHFHLLGGRKFHWPPG
ncbi:histidine triad nucleotide-binding protein [Candidatus Aerophobetes bacterium]|nr:histidine triad nucleotide-binding protein [Candidatus Aerophobetes bacterium]